MAILSIANPLKATPIVVEHTYQLLNYLRAIDIEVGYVLSFGKEHQYERRIFSNLRKNRLEH